MRRAQESLQFLLVLAFVLLGFGLIMQLQTEGLKSYAQETTAVHAQGNLERVATVVKAVWQEGKGSQRQIQLIVPVNTPTSITGGVITQTLPDTSTIGIATGASISGSLPTNPGTYAVRFTNNGSVVVISYE